MWSSARRGLHVTAPRVVQDPTEASMDLDFNGSADMEYPDDLRREVVERDTPEVLRKRIAVRALIVSSHSVDKRKKTFTT